MILYLLKKFKDPDYMVYCVEPRAIFYYGHEITNISFWAELSVSRD